MKGKGRRAHWWGTATATCQWQCAVLEWPSATSWRGARPTWIPCAVVLTFVKRGESTVLHVEGAGETQIARPVRVSPVEPAARGAVPVAPG